MTFRKLDELNDDEKDVLDSIRQMKLEKDHATFLLFRYKIIELINKYRELKQLRDEIQEKYFSIYYELVGEDLIDGELDAALWGITHEYENETLDGEM